VAQFIGKINTIPAEVAGQNGEKLVLRLLGRSLEVPSPASAFQPGKKVNAFFRPESVEVGTKAGEGRFRGRVLERMFLGEKIDYVFEVAGQRLSAASYDPFRRGTLEVGQEAEVILNPEGILLFDV
jgi:ABC-type Fe3+/spermidine/putrescine transport system ATPase subunit